MSRSMQENRARENEAILKQFRDWLAQTAEEVDALDSSAAGEESSEKQVADTVPQATIQVEEDSDSPANFTACALGPAAWTEKAIKFDETISLDQVADTGQPEEKPTAADESRLGASAMPLPEIGLRQLVEAFTAMRHETKLQTKSSRSLVDAVQSSLADLGTAMHQFQATAQSLEKGARKKEAAEEAAVSFIEAIVELDEALLRGARAFKATTQTAPERLGEMLDELFQSLPWWHRWGTRFWHRQIRRQCIETMQRASTEDLAHLKEGYALIQGRFQRVLGEHDILHIECVGRRVDPEEMNVVELVDSPEVEPETVVEEVRPGYKWRDRVIRFAEVRAAVGRRKMTADDEYCHDKWWHGKKILESGQQENDADTRPVGRGSN